MSSSDLAVRDIRFDRMAEARAAFLEEAHAIPLPEHMYAGWLIDHIKAGGAIQRIGGSYRPGVRELDYEHNVGSVIWLLTNPETSAYRMPSCYGATSFEVFVPRSLGLFCREFNVTDPNKVPHRYREYGHGQQGVGNLDVGHNTVLMTSKDGTKNGSPYTTAANGARVHDTTADIIWDLEGWRNPVIAHAIGMQTLREARTTLLD